MKNKTLGYNYASMESGTHIKILLIKQQQGRRKQFLAEELKLPISKERQTKLVFFFQALLSQFT